MGTSEKVLEEGVRDVDISSVRGYQPIVAFETVELNTQAAPSDLRPALSSLVSQVYSQVPANAAVATVASPVMLPVGRTETKTIWMISFAVGVYYDQAGAEAVPGRDQAELPDEILRAADAVSADGGIVQQPVAKRSQGIPADMRGAGADQLRELLGGAMPGRPASDQSASSGRATTGQRGPTPGKSAEIKSHSLEQGAGKEDATSREGKESIATEGGSVPSSDGTGSRFPRLEDL